MRRGGVRTGDGRLLAPVMLVGALLAAGAMEHALVTHDFTLVFVAENNSTVTPLLYSITGMWSALAGSILLWGLVLSVVVDHLRLALPRARPPTRSSAGPPSSSTSCPPSSSA